MVSMVPFYLLLLVLIHVQSSGEKRFRALDTNNDNKLSYAEAPEYFMLGMDENKNGEITAIEAITWVKEARKQQEHSMKVSRELVISKDVVYVEHPENKKEQSLDIYGPAKSEEKHPVLIYIHGGGWTLGDKSNGLGIKVPWLAERNWMLVSINYRLAPAVKHPVLVEDVAAAIAWVHTYIGKYGGAPDKIVVMGHSAGAHLAALVSTDKRKLKTHDKPLSIIKGIILLDGAGYDIPALLENPLIFKAAGPTYEKWATDDPMVWKDASPVTHVAKDIGIPEFLILHTSRQRAVEQSEKLAKLLQENGVNATVIHCGEDSHASINQKIGEQEHCATKAIDSFLLLF